MQTGLATLYSRASVGIDAPLITVEVHLANGLPGFNIVGLPEASVREAKDRVRSALINSQLEFPAKKITVNLAPADLPKEGARFDLAIAVGILVASGQLPNKQLAKYEMTGELALSGEIRPVQGILPFAHNTTEAQRTLILPQENLDEALLIKGTKLLAARQLMDVFHHLNGQTPLVFAQKQNCEKEPVHSVDMQDIIAQQGAKRALQIAAAGGHNLLMTGPPGTGKTMLAQRLMSILPPMTESEALETATIYSVTGKLLDLQRWRQRPFRHPHHTCSAVALVGGGSNPRPGEISLAHNGVLFLDEIAEFERKVLDVLREPLESGQVSISRAARQANFPARFQLIAAMNPSPTGEIGDGRSNDQQVLRYLNRVSGPLLDRIDLQVDVPKLAKGFLSQGQQQRGECSQDIAKKVQQVRHIQLQRAGKLNHLLANKELEQYCHLQQGDKLFLEQAIDALGLSIRAYHKVLRVALTIADLERSSKIQRKHLAEALSYRAFDRLLAQVKPL